MKLFLGWWLIGCLFVGWSTGYRIAKCPDEDQSITHKTLIEVAIWPAFFAGAAAHQHYSGATVDVPCRVTSVKKQDRL